MSILTDAEQAIVGAFRKVYDHHAEQAISTDVDRTVAEASAAARDLLDPIVHALEAAAPSDAPAETGQPAGSSGLPGQ